MDILKVFYAGPNDYSVSLFKDVDLVAIYHKLDETQATAKVNHWLRIWPEAEVKNHISSVMVGVS